MFLELMLIFVVFILVFGPKELPKLAYYLSRGFGYVQHLKSELRQLWEKQVHLQRLNDNEQRAEAALKGDEPE